MSPSADLTALVFAASASDPEPGSVSAYAAISSPVASLGRYFCRCSGVPNSTRGIVPMPTCAPKLTANEP